MYGAQQCHFVESAYLPPSLRLLQSASNHALAGSLHLTTANRPPLRQSLTITQASVVIVQIPTQLSQRLSLVFVLNLFLQFVQTLGNLRSPIVPTSSPLATVDIPQCPLCREPCPCRSNATMSDTHPRCCLFIWHCGQCRVSFFFRFRRSHRTGKA